jgi:hypothetical protein
LFSNIKYNIIKKSINNLKNPKRHMAYEKYINILKEKAVEAEEPNKLESTEKEFFGFASWENTSK